MRIAHVCLSNFYIDGFGYQENILPKIHKLMGHDVVIIASTESYVNKTQLSYVDPGSYINEHGIWVHRLPYSRYVPQLAQAKIRAYEGLLERLESFQPEVIFIHDVQFWDLLKIRSFAKRTPVRVLADSHTDFVNSARGFVSRRLLHGIYYRNIVRRCRDVIERFYPTLPARGDFMANVYGLDRAKMRLLPFGVDDTALHGLDRAAVRNEMRAALSIPEDACVFVTGGKLDMRKNIHVLVDRFSRLKRAGELPNCHLLVFGKPDDEVRAALLNVECDASVHMMGWVPTAEIFRAFWAADLALFPGTHSVLWEEAIGHGLGAVFHRWRGMEHLDLGGNALFLDDAHPDTLDGVLRDLVSDDCAKIRALKSVAADKGPGTFSYSAIAAQAIAPALEV
ncbi:glycosyltransferase family 4 protein [Hyphomicrobium sp. D-2]|uniref:glycosyltransferase family 4 protein n=1 Tax=Hyphomicrobium sp. D-2 TaxID=3041621 RepID=UPI002453AB11|nr:glycosyltransferase family 4 protein [Hyphomicrobium sp. D-2]MDH4980682.1 glycosyltransferase family 4 protein [Hyphomicrobium sp. D-2]